MFWFFRCNFSHLGFMAKLVEAPLRTVWRQHLERLVVFITKPQIATQRRKCCIIFRWMGAPCYRRTKSTLLNTLHLLGSPSGFYVEAHWKPQAPLCPWYFQQPLIWNESSLVPSFRKEYIYKIYFYSQWRQQSLWRYMLDISWALPLGIPQMPILGS